MQKIIIYLLFFFCCHSLVGQPMDFDQVVLPEGQPARNFESHLIQLAWLNSPSNSVMRHRVNIASFDADRSKREWLEDIALTFNLNESHFGRKDSTANNIFFPRYNLGATFNLGKFINRKYNIGKANEELMITELEENQQKLGVRAEVLYRYEKLKLAEQLEKIRADAKQEAEQAYKLATERFKSDKISFEDYNTATEHFYNAQEAHFKAQSEVNQSILALEELIGIAWEKVLPKRDALERRNRSKSN